MTRRVVAGQIVRVAGMVALAAWLQGCRTAPTPIAVAPPPAAPAPTPAPAGESECERELAAARLAFAEREAGTQAAEGRLAELKARLLEKSAEVASLGARQAELQLQLDAAILEVVRATAKLRSLESRAEAASTMAEAEAALNSLAATGAGVRPAELGKAGELLRMSAGEFEKENYGGALFLAGQAKSHLRAAEPRLATDVELLPGEVALAAPLELRVMTGANLRDGPGQEFRVLTTLPRGAAVTALSRKDRWVRVRDPHGSTGWVFEALLDLR